jgi:YHS domain-containing protein
MQYNLFNHCDHCGTMHPATETVTHTIHLLRASKVYHFCSETCREHFARRRIDWAGVNNFGG